MRKKSETRPAPAGVNEAPDGTPATQDSPVEVLSEDVAGDVEIGLKELARAVLPDLDELLEGLHEWLSQASDGDRAGLLGFLKAEFAGELGQPGLAQTGKRRYLVRLPHSPEAVVHAADAHEAFDLYRGRMNLISTTHPHTAVEVPEDAQVEPGTIVVGSPD